MRRKILLASSAFYPEKSPRAFRATELAKEFSRQGHSVTVLTLPLGRETENFCYDFEIKLKYVSARRFRGLPVQGSKFFSLFSRAFNRIMLLLLEFPDIELMFSYRKALCNENGYDLLISFAVPYPVHWGVAWARGSNHEIATHWMADCGDPYMGNESDSFKHLFYFKWLEKWMFRKTNSIAIPIESARTAYYLEFQSKIFTSPQGVDFAYLQSFCKPYFPNKTVTFAYAGTFIPGKRDPRNLLDYLLGLSIPFQFIIFTHITPWLIAYEARSKGRIVLNPYTSREELISYLSQMDFLINVENSTLTQAPSKLVDYYLSKRPVLSVTSSQTNFSVVKDFIGGNFKMAINLSAIENYRIEFVVSKILNTCIRRDDV